MNVSDIVVQRFGQGRKWTEEQPDQAAKDRMLSRFIGTPWVSELNLRNGSPGETISLWACEQEVEWIVKETQTATGSGPPRIHN